MRTRAGIMAAFNGLSYVDFDADYQNPDRAAAMHASHVAASNLNNGPGSTSN